MIKEVAVEKLFAPKFAKIKLRQEALQSILSGRRDIFYPPQFRLFGTKSEFFNSHGSYHSQRRKDYSNGACALLNPAHSWRTADPQYQN
jgi:hypothetical protein